VSSLPFHTYLWKIASRCNLNCTYCYVYNLADSQYLRQPKFMPVETAATTARRMREHLEEHGKEDATIVFHGGEPLLAAPGRLREYLCAIGEAFDGSAVELTVGIQSNLLLFTAEIGELLLEAGVSIGASVDGPPRVTDRHRLDLAGRPTGERLERKLELLTSERYRPAFSGFLSVVDIETTPIEVLDYLLAFEPPSIDLLLPLDNHDRRPPGKQGAAIASTPYADWMIEAFDHWLDTPSATSIRYFESIIRMLCGGPTLVESLGLLPVDLVVIEADGEIEAVDSLKGALDGATRLGFNVFDHGFGEPAGHVAVKARQMGALSLCSTCAECELVDVCGGGYLPHRYSRANGFDNPSVYCADLKKLIRHIDSRLRRELRGLAGDSERVAA
jgi:uncharacterized protein